MQQEVKPAPLLSAQDFFARVRERLTLETPHGLNDPNMIRSSVGVGLLWDSPLGPLRFDLAYPLTKYCAMNSAGGEVCDRTQVFRFSGGTKF